MPLRKLTQSDESGSALLEFALALMVILTLLLGTIDLGRALYAYDWVSNAARLGTRYMMVRGNSCTLLTNYPVTGGCPATQTDVQNYLKTQAIGIGTSSPPLTITASCYVTSTGKTNAPPCGVGGYAIVKVQYQFSFLSPLMPKTWTMTSTSERVVQN